MLETLPRQTDRTPLPPHLPSSHQTTKGSCGLDLQPCFLQTNPYITNPMVVLSLIEFFNALIHASYSLINNLSESTLLSDNSSFTTNLCDCLLDNPFSSIKEFLDCKIDVEM